MLAFVRHLNDEVILVVANLSRFVLYVELDLSKWKGLRPVEMMGQSEMPPIGDTSYLLTLGGHAFYWLSLEAPPPEAEAEAVASYRPPVLEAQSPQSLLHGTSRAALEEALPGFLYTRRWFARRRNTLTAVHVEDAIEMPGISLLVLRVEYASAEPDRFVIPLAMVGVDRPPPPGSILAVLHTPTGDVTLIDAAEDAAAARALLAALSERRRVAAELEVTHFLNQRVPGLTPQVVATFQLRRGRAEPSTLAVLEAYVPNEGTAWTHAREELRRFFDRALTRYRETPPPPDAVARRSGDRRRQHGQAITQEAQRRARQVAHRLILRSAIQRHVRLRRERR